MSDYDRLVSRHKDAVYRQMVRVCGNHDDAEDVLVEALTAAYRHSGQLRDQGAFRQWVMAIGKRLCLGLRKRSDVRALFKSEGFDQLADETPDAQVQVERSQLAECVRVAVEALPDIYSEVYVACELDGQAVIEFARQHGVSLAAAKSRLHRARALVRARLDASVCASLGPA